MATGDMKARLLLDSKDFEKNIKKSKRDATDFNKSINNGSKGLQGFGGVATAAMGKLAAATAAATAAWDLMRKGINSSQMLTDGFGAAVESLKTSVDNLMYSVANADFTTLAAGMSETAARAREMYNAFDQLANTNMSAKFSMTLDQTKYRELMARARNKNLTPEEREAALAEARAIGEQMKAVAGKVEKDSYVALKSMFAAKAGVVGGSDIFTPEMIEKAFRIDASAQSDEARKNTRLRFAEYNKAVEAIQLKYYTDPRYHLETFFKAGSNKPHKQSQMRLKEIAALQEQYADTLVEYIALMRLGDEELNSAMDTYLNAVQQRSAAAEIETSVNEVSSTLKNEAMAAQEKIRKQAEAAAKSRAEESELYSIYAQRGAAGGNAGVSFGNEGLSSLAFVGSAAAKRRKDARNPLAGDYAIAPLQGLQSIDGALIEDAAAQGERFAQVTTSVDMLSSSFGALGGAIGGAAGEMMTFVGSILDAASAIVPFITQLMAEKIAHEEVATAATAEASAKAMSAHAGIPFAGIALGLTAVSAIVAALQSLPKFAEGGIVTSATLGVFGEAGPEAVLPLDKLKDYIGGNEVRVTGNIKASGKELVVVLDNYNRVRNG